MSVAAQDNEVALFGYWRSSCSWRVRIALNLKGIKFDYRVVNLLKGEQRGDDYTKMNSNQLVPTLEIDGKSLTQSLAIIEYLDATRRENGPQLIPSDPYTASVVRAQAQIVACEVQPVANLRVMKVHGMDKKVEWAQHWITVGFKALEAQVSKTAGKYCVGDEVTLVDVVLIPQIYNAERYKVDMNLYPTLKRVGDALALLPEFVAAHADTQPDAVKS